MHHDAPLPADCRLLNGRMKKFVHFPVAMPLAGQARLDYIKIVWQTMSWEKLRNLLYYMLSPYWDGAVEVG